MLAEPAGVGYRYQGGRGMLRDLSCGRCAQCLARCTLWCADPAPAGPVLLDLELPAAVGEPDGQLLRMLTAVAAFAGAGVPATATVLVLGADFGALTELIRLVHAGVLLGAPDPADPDLRAQLTTLTAGGRADVVVTTEQARTAVKAVLRGGLVCLPASAVSAPSVTELVQREVSLIGATELAPLIRQLGAGVIENALRRS